VFLILNEDGLQTAQTWDLGEHMVCPPKRESMPWLLPKASAVLYSLQVDDDRKLFEELVDYHRSVSELPCQEHYILLALYDMLTYLQERLTYMPILCFYGVPERGKSRTGKAITYAAYRGVHETTVRDAHLIRYCAEFRSTLFLDTMDLWGKVEKQGSEDVILGRFEQGSQLRRVLWPEKGLYRDSQYYEIFGPTIIATNRNIDHVLQTRALSITLPEATRPFTSDIRPEDGLVFRERLLAFRARHLGDPLPKVEKSTEGRLGDITRPIIQMASLVCPDQVKVMAALIEEFRLQRLHQKAETMEAVIFAAFLRCEGEVENGRVSLMSVVTEINKERGENKQLSSKYVGGVLQSLGIESGGKIHGGKRAFRWPSEEQIYILSKSLGLSEEPSPSSPSSPDQDESRVNTGKSNGEDSGEEPHQAHQASPQGQPSPQNGEDGEDGEAQSDAGGPFEYTYCEEQDGDGEWEEGLL
jgi:hypothetical protein